MMKPTRWAPTAPAALGLLTVALLAGPRSVRGQAAQAPAYPGRYPYTEADVHFTTGMISHHAQALVMCGWAPTHGARATRVLCERIINAQSDEIHLMQDWLGDRHQPVPEAKPMPMTMMVNGVAQEMLMPGMLTDEQMQQLDQARDSEFDRAFLRFMIQHHEGAITMVNELFGSPGAGQDDFVFKLASDIYADQSTEIERMKKMLAAFPPR